MGTAKSSVSHTFNSNGHCGDDLARRSTPIRIARDLLGRDCNTHGHAINSRRDSFNFCRTHRRDCAWCSGRSVPGKLFHRKSCGLRSCGICAGTFLRRISHGKKRLPLCEYHFRHHRAYPSFKRAWIVALHRFFEVSVGIVVALALAAVWPEHQPAPAKESAE